MEHTSSWGYVIKKLEWNDGMSVGVEAIDNDHKRLISLITELSTAIQDNSTNELLGSIFDELVNYVKIHFSREERLMSECGYDGFDDHVKQHQAFARKIPELKEHLLASSSLEVAVEVDLFLYNWLSQHILIDDMSYAQKVYEEGAADGGVLHESLTNYIVDLAQKYLTLGWRLVLLALIPAIGLVALTWPIFSNNLNEHQELKELRAISEVSSQINFVIHELQLERGLTSGANGANLPEFHNKLIEQRKMAQPAIKQLKKVFEKYADVYPGEEMHRRLNLFFKQASSAESFYIKVDNHQIGYKEAQGFYTKQIVRLLDVIEHIAHLQTTQQLSEQTRTLASALYLKETLGQVRALGVYVTSKSNISREEIESLSFLIAQQNWWLETINRTATKRQKSVISALYPQDPESKKKSPEYQLVSAIESNKLQGLNGFHWFKLTSDKVNNLKKVTEELVQDLNDAVNESISSLKAENFLMLALLFLIFTLILISSLILYRSIIFPVTRLRGGLSALAKGDKSQRFTERLSDRLFADMFDAYETSRRALLQADVIATTNLYTQSRKKDFYKSQASIDPLTGIMNRRAFYTCAENEIKRAHRYKTKLSLMMLDLDHFKKVNDTHGHAVGDLLLQEFTKNCLAIIREADIFARLGGEEFAVLIPETGIEGALVFAERIRLSIEKMTISTETAAMTITVSIGLADLDQSNAETIHEMLAYADELLYEAKGSGRNKVSFLK